MDYQLTIHWYLYIICEIHRYLWIIYGWCKDIHRFCQSDVFRYLKCLRMLKKKWNASPSFFGANLGFLCFCISKQSRSFFWEEKPLEAATEITVRVFQISLGRGGPIFDFVWHSVDIRDFEKSRHFGPVGSGGLNIWVHASKSFGTNWSRFVLILRDTEAIGDIA